jgi:hypothetical protein
MGSDPDHGQDEVGVRADLVEYLIVAVADRSGLASVGQALAGLVEAGTVRLLDLVVVSCDEDGLVAVEEIDAEPALAALRAAPCDVDLLSERDIELSSLAIPPGSVGVVVVTEDRWAEPLSTAASRAGGRIVAGDRIPPSRVEAALARSHDEPSVGP